MIVSISGSEGVGKSTLLNYFTRKTNFEAIEEKAEEAAKAWKGEHYTSLLETLEEVKDSPEDYVSLQFDMVKRWEHSLPGEFSAKPGNGDYITDRSPIDSAAYLLMNVASRLSQKDTEDALVPMLKASRKVDLHVIIPFETSRSYLKKSASKLGEEGWRVNNTYYTEAYQDILLGVLVRSNTPFVMLEGETIVERYSSLKKIIKSYRLGG